MAEWVKTKKEKELQNGAVLLVLPGQTSGQSSSRFSPVEREHIKRTPLFTTCSETADTVANVHPYICFIYILCIFFNH